MKSRCFWWNHERDWFCFFLLDTQAIYVSLSPLKVPLDIRLGWHQRNVSQRRDADHCQTGQGEAPATVLLFFFFFFLIPPFWSNHDSCRFDEESQDGKDLGLWLSSWWIPPWNLCDLEINYTVLSHWMWGRIIVCSSHRHLDQEIYSTICLTLSHFCAIRGFESRNIWI